MEALAFLIPHTAWQNLLMFLKTERLLLPEVAERHPMEMTGEVACEVGGILG